MGIRIGWMTRWLTQWLLARERGSVSRILVTHSPQNTGQSSVGLIGGPKLWRCHASLRNLQSIRGQRVLDFQGSQSFHDISVMISKVHHISILKMLQVCPRANGKEFNGICSILNQNSLTQCTSLHVEGHVVIYTICQLKVGKSSPLIHQWQSRSSCQKPNSFGLLGIPELNSTASTQERGQNFW